MVNFGLGSTKAQSAAGTVSESVGLTRELCWNAVLRGLRTSLAHEIVRKKYCDYNDCGCCDVCSLHYLRVMESCIKANIGIDG